MKKSKKTSIPRSKKRKSKPSNPKQSSPQEDWNTTEAALTADLDEELLEAWEKIRDFSLSLGEQRVYASGKAIMFSKKVCFFFVRPKKSFLEVVIFLSEQAQLPNFKTPQAVSKTKFAHTFKLVHADQVEGELTEAIKRAFEI